MKRLNHSILEMLKGAPAYEFSIDVRDSETMVLHPVGPTCNRSDRHAASECDGLVVEDGPFEECGCASHISRKMPNGPLEDQRP